jgi:D-alanine-D-alanine ligase
MTRRVAVLMGGWSAEREVSLVSGKAVGKALGEAGFDVELVDVDRDIATVLGDMNPDVAFNALHGRYGEDGLIQGVLEILQIPYTHSGVLASALAMDKPVARTLFEAAGMRCAEGMVLTRRQLIDGQGFEPPYVIKPINEGSSVGVRLVFEGDNFHFEDDTAWTFGDQVLVERYIPGKEIQVAVMGDRALGAIEIRPHGRFYDYEAKYTDDKANHLMPAPIDEVAYAEALRLGLLIHQTLGCRGVSRADLRYDDTGEGEGAFYVLETNTQPGMTPLSLVPEIAAYQGIDFTELVTWMVEDASCDR